MVRGQKVMTKARLVLEKRGLKMLWRWRRGHKSRNVMWLLDIRKIKQTNFFPEPPESTALPWLSFSPGETIQKVFWPPEFGQENTKLVVIKIAAKRKLTHWGTEFLGEFKLKIKQLPNRHYSVCIPSASFICKMRTNNVTSLAKVNI